MGGQILPAVAKLLEADDVPVLVTKVDTERYPQTASRYGVSALPTIVGCTDSSAINYYSAANSLVDPSTGDQAVCLLEVPVEHC